MPRPELARVASIEERMGNGWLRPLMVLLAWLLSVVAAQGQASTKPNLPTLTQVKQIREMTIEEARRGYPVRIRGVVTYFDQDAGDLFIQDSTAGIWVSPGQTKLALHQGEFVEVEGPSAAGDLAPEIDHAHFRSLGEAPMPKPRRPTSDELASGRLDSQWIELQGVVRSVAERNGKLALNVSSGAFECSVFVLKYPSVPSDIVDGHVRIRGVFAGLYDSSSVRVIGFQVHTPSWSDIEVLDKPTQALWSEPVRPLPLFLRLTPEGAFTHRAHIRGVVTLQHLGQFLCIRDGEGALLVNTTQPTPLKIGDVIDAMGFPAIGDYTVIMRDAIFRRVGGGPAPEPVGVNLEEQGAGKRHADLVRLSARLLNHTTKPGEEVLELQTGGEIFRAVLNTGTNSSPLGSLRTGSLLQLTGVMIVQADKNHEPEGFEILLRSPADVVVLELPSWWTLGRVLRVLGLLAMAVILALGWIAALRRRVRQQTETLRLKYEHELALEEQYRDLFENASDLIHWVDPHGRILHVNPAWRKTLGYSEEEVANLSIFDIVRPNYREDYRGLLQRLKSGEKIDPVEVEFVAKSGETVVLEGNCDCQFVDGKPVSTRGILRNVTERRRGEELLAQERRLFNILMNNVPDKVYFKDTASRFLRVNRAHALSLGLADPAEAIGKSDFDFRPHEIALEAFNDEKRILDTAEPLIGKIERAHGPEQQVRWNLVTKVPFKDTLGQVAGIVGVSCDITEKRQAEQALQESEERFRSLFENSTVGIYRTTPDGRILTANPTLVRMLGFERFEELAERDLEKEGFEAGYPRPAFRKRIEKEGVVRGLEAAWRKKDGSVTFARESARAIRDDGGRVIYYDGIVEDITDRKRAEEAQRFLACIVESSDYAIFGTGPDGTIVSWNPAAEALFGYDASEILGNNVSTLVPLDRREEVPRVLDGLRRGEGFSHFETTPVRKDGARVTVSLSISPIKSAAGEVIGAATIAYDISKRKQAEEALHESEALLNKVGEIAKIGGWEMDLITRRARWTRGTYDIAEIEPGDWIPGPDEHVGYYLPEDRSLVAEAMRALIEADKPLDFEARLRTAKGNVKWCHAIGEAVREGDKCVKVRGTFQDITEPMRAEDAIRRQALVFENTTDAIFLLGADHRIVDWNQAAERTFGYSKQEVLGKTPEFMADPSERHEVSERIRRALKQVGRWTGEQRVRRKDGTISICEKAVMAVHDQSGRLVGGVCVSRDITEQRQLEEQFRQAQKMEAVGRLAAGVAHDFNNLLTIIMGYSDFLLQTLSPGDRTRPRVEEIKKAGGRAASLTRQLLAFSRKQVLQPQVLDLNGLLSNVDDMLRRVIGEDIELVTRLTSGLGHVKADPGQIEQVVLNLALNARDAMPQGGQLTLETANIELDSSYASRHEGVLPGQYVMLAVSDTGIGMDRETQAYIFEPFFTTKEPGKGTGLGLAMAYGTVKQSGGSIWVYSEPGKGTTVKVYLPRVDQPVEVIASAESSVEELSRGCEIILLAEDEEAVRSLVKETLESEGYRVLEAKGATEALEIGERHKEHIHLLLTDVVMPQMSGRELAEHLAPLHPETKVFYMSGYADHAAIRRGLLDPGTPLLQKPFTTNALVRKVRKVLRNTEDHNTAFTTCASASTAECPEAQKVKAGSTTPAIHREDRSSCKTKI